MKSHHPSLQRKQLSRLRRGRSFAGVLLSLCAIVLLSGCSPQLAANPDLDSTTKDSIAINPANINSGENPILIPNVDNSTIPVPFRTIPDNPQFFECPFTLTDLTVTEPAEYLPNESTEPPLRPLYVLTPGHRYHLTLDSSQFSDRTDPVQTSLTINHTKSIPDTKIGAVNFKYTEVYADGQAATYYCEFKFVADSPEGITLSVDYDSIDGYRSQHEFVFQVQSGQSAVTSADFFSKEPRQDAEIIVNAGDYAILDPETDYEEVQYYLYAHPFIPIDLPRPATSDLPIFLRAE